jgi:hypothetical protein
MDDPDMVLGIDGYADGLTLEPMVRQRLGPQRIHLEHGRLHCGSLDSGPLLQQGRPDSERNQKNRKCCPNTEITLHNPVPPSVPAKSVLLARHCVPIEDHIEQLSGPRIS